MEMLASSPLADDDDGADSEAGGPVEEAEEAIAMAEAPALATPIALIPESRPMLTRLQAPCIVYGARFC